MVEQTSVTRRLVRVLDAETIWVARAVKGVLMVTMATQGEAAKSATVQEPTECNMRIPVVIIRGPIRSPVTVIVATQDQTAISVLTITSAIPRCPVAGASHANVTTTSIPACRVVAMLVRASVEGASTTRKEDFAKDASAVTTEMLRDRTASFACATSWARGPRA